MWAPMQRDLNMTLHITTLIERSQPLETSPDFLLPMWTHIVLLHDLFIVCLFRSMARNKLWAPHAPIKYNPDFMGMTG